MRIEIALAALLTSFAARASQAAVAAKPTVPAGASAFREAIHAGGMGAAAPNLAAANLAVSNPGVALQVLGTPTPTALPNVSARALPTAAALRPAGPAAIPGPQAATAPPAWATGLTAVPRVHPAAGTHGPERPGTAMSRPLVVLGGQLRISVQSGTAASFLGNLFDSSARRNGGFAVAAAGRTVPRRMNLALPSNDPRSPATEGGILRPSLPTKVLSAAVPLLSASALMAFFTLVFGADVTVGLAAGGAVGALLGYFARPRNPGTTVTSMFEYMPSLIWVLGGLSVGAAVGDKFGPAIRAAIGI